jgi:hypothetical protein
VQPPNNEVGWKDAPGKGKGRIYYLVNAPLPAPVEIQAGLLPNTPKKGGSK